MATASADGTWWPVPRRDGRLTGLPHVPVPSPALRAPRAGSGSPLGCGPHGPLLSACSSSSGPRSLEAESPSPVLQQLPASHARCRTKTIRTNNLEQEEAKPARSLHPRPSDQTACRPVTSRPSALRPAPRTPLRAPTAPCALAPRPPTGPAAPFGALVSLWSLL